MHDLTKRIDAILPDIVALRRDLHAHPELGFDEQRTAHRIVEALTPIEGLSIRTGVARTGVVAMLNADKPGPCVLLRADMDALPIEEQTGLPYASQNPGRMHACGHDGHTSCLVGAAHLLASMADALPGRIKFIFQPAEENEGGARYMCEAGILSDPPVDAAFALHGWPGQSVGRVAVTRGPAMAAVDSGSLTVHGVGSHGAYPHRSVDPILVASHIVVAFQAIVARTVDPLDCAVVTVGAIHGGTVQNVIPPECSMLFTLRSHRATTRAHLREKVTQVAEHTAAAFGARVEFRWFDGYPVTVNDPALSDWVVHVARDVCGADNVVTDDPPSMGAEDFGFIAERVPAVMFRLGLRPAGADSYPSLHHPQFNFNDDALPLGIRMFCELAMRYLRQPPPR